MKNITMWKLSKIDVSDRITHSEYMQEIKRKTTIIMHMHVEALTKNFKSLDSPSSSNWLDLDWLQQKFH